MVRAKERLDEELSIQTEQTQQKQQSQQNTETWRTKRFVLPCLSSPPSSVNYNPNKSYLHSSSLDPISWMTAVSRQMKTHVSNAALLNIIFFLFLFIDIIINIVINSSKTGEHRYVVPIEDFYNSKILHVQPQNMMPGGKKIYIFI